jgi:Ras-related GTP-binding protein A/B
MISKSKEKVLLMGRNEAGKTSMQSIIFSQMKPKETEYLMYTNKINVSSINFLGTEFTLADCGGQQTHLDEYLSKYPEDVFSNVTMLIYVFDIEYMEDKNYKQSYIDILSRLAEFSPNSKIFVLIHKIDKIKVADLPIKKRLCTQIVQDLTSNNSLDKIFFTSIWDDTLYNAWSQIVQSMIPVLKEISQTITEFGQTNHCDEIVLLEKDTFLIVSNYEMVPTREDISYGRYERIAGIFKMLKINCRDEELENITIKNYGFQAVLRKYTENTYILIIQKNDKVNINSVLYNLEVLQHKNNQEGKSEIDVLRQKH